MFRCPAPDAAFFDVIIDDYLDTRSYYCSSPAVSLMLSLPRHAFFLFSPAFFIALAFSPCLILMLPLAVDLLFSDAAMP